MSGLTEKLRRVYVPMTETGFYISFVSRKKGMATVLLKKSRN
ncbi:PadR family transcriptional regulator [Streptococcus gordonii]|nr:PadR family transcriptional regulator [Streptococcus gordonii]